MKHSAQGFTLLELLIVMVIISILASISLPQYGSYRRRGFDIRAVSDLRNAAVAEEAYFMDYERYINCTDNQCAGLPGIGALSKGVRMQMTVGESAFSGWAKHTQGTGKTFRWDSEHGGLQE